jgi:tRNA pseudouridine55 synthase
VSHVQDGGKIYRFEVKWGAETSTDDLEGETTATSLKRPTREEIEDILIDFTGEILQAPPAFSAIKINGARAYDLARKGETPEMKSRPIRIDDLRLVEMIEEEATIFEATCGKGTYIRALARDMGRELGCLGHVTSLRRLKSGPFDCTMSISLEKLRELSHSAAAEDVLQQQLLPIETALDDIPALAISKDHAAQLRLGQSILLKGRDAPLIAGPAYAMAGSSIIALGEVSKGEFKPSRVFNLAT